MPPSFGYGAPPGPDPVEFTSDDVMLNTWTDEASDYLQLDRDEISQHEAPLPDQA
jgi:hypothetical protein